MKAILKIARRGLLVLLDVLLSVVIGFPWFAVDAANRVPRRNVQTGREALIGAVGVARTELAPAGTVFVQGELWSAKTEGVIPAGQRVRVIRMEGLRLEVRKEESSQWQRS